jgi:hypothetical protein
MDGNFNRRFLSFLRSVMIIVVLALASFAFLGKLVTTWQPKTAGVIPAELQTPLPRTTVDIAPRKKGPVSGALVSGSRAYPIPSTPKE